MKSLAKELVSMSIDKMTVFLSSGDVEAQERVCFFFLYSYKIKQMIYLGKCYFKYSENCIKIN